MSGAGEELVTPDHPDFPLRLDPADNFFVSAWGRKKSGKSCLNRLIYSEWPGDKLCIDVNRDAEPGEDAVKVPTPVPGSFPTPMRMPGERAKPQNLHYIANPLSPTYRDDLDRAVGMALFPQEHRVLVWGGEVGELQPNAKPADHMRLLLMQNRHYNASCLWDGPRPMNVDPLTLTQSDLIALFPLPMARDRQRIAETIGVPLRDLERECREVWRRGPHHFLLYHLGQDTLWRCPPLPLGDTSPAPAGEQAA